MMFLGIDPGNTTGWVRVRVVGREAVLGSWGTFDGIPGLAQECESLGMGIECVVIEEYRVYPHKAEMHIGSTVFPAQIIGAVKLLATFWSVMVIEQGAGIAKSRWPLARIKKLFPEVKFKSSARTLMSDEIGRHATDALRHVLNYLERKDLIDIPLVEEDIV